MTKKKVRELTAQPLGGPDGDREVLIEGTVFDLADGPPTRREMLDAEYELYERRVQWRKRRKVVE